MGFLQHVVVKSLFSRPEDQKRQARSLMGYRYLGRLCLTDHWRKPHPVVIYSCDPARHGLGLEGQLHEAVLIDQRACGSGASERSRWPLAFEYLGLS